MRCAAASRARPRVTSRPRARAKKARRARARAKAARKGKARMKRRGDTARHGDVGAARVPPASAISRAPRSRAASCKRRKSGHLFVVQKHAARRLHYDLRLELDGVLKSWAVTRGPSLSPADKRLAVRVEDHPLDYAEFEGRIPEGEYGAGSIIVWDRGALVDRRRPAPAAGQGPPRVRAEGHQAQGPLASRAHAGARQGGKENWLLIKAEDEYAVDGRRDGPARGQAPLRQDRPHRRGRRRAAR